MSKIVKRIAIVLFLAIVIYATESVSAQSSTPAVPDDAVNAIAKDMYCPVCENVPLDVCGTQACQQWRDLIRERLADGWTEKEIKDYFVRQYGDRVLAEPPRRGLNWLVYIIPPVVVFAGLLLVFRVVRSWNASSPGMISAGSKDESEPPNDIAKDDYVLRLEDELRRRA